MKSAINNHKAKKDRGAHTDSALDWILCCHPEEQHKALPKAKGGMGMNKFAIASCMFIAIAVLKKAIGREHLKAGKHSKEGKISNGAGQRYEGSVCCSSPHYGQCRNVKKRFFSPYGSCHNH